MTARPTDASSAAHADRRAARRRALRSVRPRLAALWVTVLLAATLLLAHPLSLTLLLAALVGGGRAFGAGSTVARLLRFAIPFALVLLVFQTLIDRTGLTVIARLGDAGPFGQLDVTLEALTGAVTQALRVLCGITVSALALELVDVDRALASVRRRAPRFGVTATLALRLAPAMAADGRRYADGLRSRADATGRLGVHERRLVVDALVARSLDRATAAAGILELRGLGRADRGGPRDGGAWAAVEWRVALSAATLTVALLAIVLLGLDR